MACENDKCEKYGMHHDYENGVEVRKCQFCTRDETATTRGKIMGCHKCEMERRIKNGEKKSIWFIPDQHTCNRLERSKREDSEYGAKCNFGLWKSEMRCSEHDGNAVREVQ